MGRFGLGVGIRDTRCWLRNRPVPEGRSTHSWLEFVGLYNALEGDLLDPHSLRVLRHELLGGLWLLEGAYDEPCPAQRPEVPR